MESWKEPLSRWPTWQCIHLSICTLSPRNMWPVALTVTWLITTWAPRTGSRREPETDSHWERAKLPGGLLSCHLWVSKVCTLKWNRKSEHCLLSWFCRGDDLWDRSLPFSQITQNLNKTSFLLHQHLPHEFGFCGDRQPNRIFFPPSWLHWLSLSEHFIVNSFLHSTNY